jgi:NAD(P) transhydrogenase subunit alpha
LSAGSGGETIAIILGTCSVALATTNVVGGYMVTNRMLAMFKKKKEGSKS